jgi:hypothetical protein
VWFGNTSHSFIAVFTPIALSQPPDPPIKPVEIGNFFQKAKKSGTEESSRRFYTLCNFDGLFSVLLFI